VGDLLPNQWKEKKKKKELKRSKEVFHQIHPALHLCPSAPQGHRSSSSHLPFQAIDFPLTESFPTAHFAIISPIFKEQRQNMSFLTPVSPQATIQFLCSTLYQNSSKKFSILIVFHLHFT
jgi:hypothetical protein